MLLDEDLEQFETAIRALQDEQYDQRRKEVSDKSRFVWLSVMTAILNYSPALLRDPGLTTERRLDRVRRLFEEAMELLSARKDQTYDAVCQRWQKIQQRVPT